MEVFFLDVAQGTCQVILLGERRAIVVDCGLRNDQIVLQFLRRAGVEFLDRLIVSHSHDDHIGGAVAILGEYQGRISKICFVQDHLFLESAFWKRISELLRSGRLSPDHLVRLEATSDPQEVWNDNSKTIRLRTWSPTAAQNLLAQQAGSPNPTSAVLFLDIRAQRIIFAADSEVSQWQEIHRQAGTRMKCDVLAVPHHAGRAHSSRAELDWLFQQALSVDVAIVSVGTSNTHNHPREDVIAAMSSQGISVLCTQITRRCADNLESIRPGVLKPVVNIGRSSPTQDLTSAGNSRNVGCAGTVRVEATQAGLQVHRLNEHQQAVDSLASRSAVCPLCRRSP